MHYISVLLPYIVLSFLFNFFWESWHGIYLYTGEPDYSQTIQQYLHVNTLASLQDATSLLIIFVIIALATNGLMWWRKLTVSKIGMFALLAVGGAYVSEIYATEFAGWWNYNELMPTILGAGLSPLVQIFVTGTLAVLLMNLLSHSNVTKQTEKIHSDDSKEQI